ncbi:MAG: flagellar biosynthesis protein FlhA [Nitrospinae bacterium]|nr:flagellar biosynthesis protein FlhA [Nitrospinota bacterium]
MAQVSNIKSPFLEIVGKYSDYAIAVGVVAILIFMMIPLPTAFLDLLLVFGITFSLVILLVAVYILSPLEFSIFPTVLLVATLYRLSMNIASTRLILLNGDRGESAAGQVIKAFGDFVVGGNYVVGMVIFLILVTINFIVITKGSTRTSEVAARFTLDAIPGKQMSIDADLNAGLISEEEAKQRREDLQSEADFYGSMDGSMKFVRGDAVAGIVITAINLIGGLIIGVAQLNMSLSDAASTYTLLTVGDGLVSQIPALVVSTAAAIVLTRAGKTGESLGNQVVEQILYKPKVFLIASMVLFMFGIIPGLPFIPFFVLSIVSAIIYYYSNESQTSVNQREEMARNEEASAPIPEKVEALLPLDTMELEVGYELIPLVDAEQNGELLERIRSIRRQFALEMGIIVPPLHIRDNLQLKPNEYTLMVKGVKVGSGELILNHFLAMSPEGNVDGVEGVKTIEPTFGLPAVWVAEELKDDVQSRGMTVVDAPTVITTHIKEIIRSHAHELLGRQETQALLDNAKQTHPKVVDELIPGVLSLGKVVNVLQELLKESISIRDLVTILETLADYGEMTKDVELLTEYVRASLARQITKQYMNPNGEIFVVTLNPATEEKIINAIKKTDTASYLALDPTDAQNILNSISNGIEAFSGIDQQPIILVSPSTRLHLRKLTERFIPNMVVLSHNEITSDANVQTVGTID